MIWPHLYLDSILELKTDYLAQQKVRSLFLDVDGTLKDHGAMEVKAEVIDWLRLVRGTGISLCLFSNGRAPRIEKLARQLDVSFVAEAFKPFPFRCRRALREQGLLPREVAVVGDQIYADVLVGRLSRMHTILVKPSSRIEPWFTRLKRPFEAPILWKLRRAKARMAAALHNAAELIGDSADPKSPDSISFHQGS